MIRYFFVVVFLFFISLNIFGQAVIRGFVYEKSTGEPVMFANIQLTGTKYGATTDVNGYFNINKLPAGTYNLLSVLSDMIPLLLK